MQMQSSFSCSAGYTMLSSLAADPCSVVARRGVLPNCNAIANFSISTRIMCPRLLSLVVLQTYILPSGAYDNGVYISLIVGGQLKGSKTNCINHYFFPKNHMIKE